MLVEPGTNVEARARTARYDALERARADLRATAILVGHTADDQAETVLLNLLRGSASAGLGAMSVRRDHVVRPMLAIRRRDTEALCADLALDPVRDPSNDDTTFRRNWVRHVVLPLLSEGSERDLVPVLARQAALLRDDAEFLDQMARARCGRPTASVPRVRSPRSRRCSLAAPCASGSGRRPRRSTRSSACSPSLAARRGRRRWGVADGSGGPVAG